jgi:hypothetical protein
VDHVLSRCQERRLAARSLRVHRELLEESKRLVTNTVTEVRVVFPHGDNDEMGEPKELED